MDIKKIRNKVNKKIDKLNENRKMTMNKRKVRIKEEKWREEIRK